MAEKDRGEEFDTIPYSEDSVPQIKSKIAEIMSAFQVELKAGRILWGRSGYEPKSNFRLPLISCRARQVLSQYITNESSKDMKSKTCEERIDDNYRLHYPVWLASYQMPLKGEVAWDIPIAPSSNAA